jgi:hypothetical protein
MKTSVSGDSLWTKTYSGSGYFIMQTSDGGYMVIGADSPPPEQNSDLWILKTDSLGDTLTGIAEQPPVTHLSNWQITASVGSQIILRYSNHPGGFHASIFDASGRKVDELHAPLPSGTISWGQGFGQGVYFIRDMSFASGTVHKVVLTK